MTVSDSGRKSVTACPTIFDPTSTKTATSARENRHDRHKKRQTRRADQGPTLPRRKVVLKCLRVLVNVSKIHHDHSYLRRQGQVIETLRSDNGDGNGNVRSLGRAGLPPVGVPAKIEITNFTSENVDDGH